MKDRYLYRAKQKGNEEWITGQYVKGLDMYDKEVHLIFEPATILYSSGETDGWSEIDPATICQCTGLKDKNGNLIWENDIIKDKHGNFYKAFWQDNYYQFFWICVKSDIFSIGAKWDLWSFKSFEIEVIGNIFDNKELLEVRDSMTEKNNKEPSPCSGCKYEKSINIKELLAFYTHCKRAYSHEEDREIHEDRYEEDIT